MTVAGFKILRADKIFIIAYFTARARQDYQTCDTINKHGVRNNMA